MADVVKLIEAFLKLEPEERRIFDDYVSGYLAIEATESTLLEAISYAEKMVANQRKSR